MTRPAKLNKWQRRLSPADVTALMQTAQWAWDALPSNGRSARFEWRGGAYVVSASNFRMFVHAADGSPVAHKFHD